MKKTLLRLSIAAALSMGALLVGSPAQAAAQQYSPCAKLSAGETKFSAYGANRAIFTTATDYGVSQVLITSCVRSGSGYVQEWQTTGYGGLKGFAPPGQMWEDTYYSPTGSFTTTEALGRSNPGTALSYHTVNPNSRWGGERGATYNQYFEGVGGESDENLYTYMNQGYYEQAAVINWNRQPDMPVTQGASFAIFFHAGSTTSAGCISTDLGTVTRMLRTAVPGDRFIMGTVGDVFSPAAPPKPAPAPAEVPVKVAPAPSVVAPEPAPVIAEPVTAPEPSPEPTKEAPAPEPAVTDAAAVVTPEPTPTPTDIEMTSDTVNADTEAAGSYSDSLPVYVAFGIIVLIGAAAAAYFKFRPGHLRGRP